MNGPHKRIGANAHDHDYNLYAVLNTLGIDRATLPKQWAGTVSQLATLLNVSDQQLEAAFGCNQCRDNNRKRWNDRISFGAAGSSEPMNELKQQSRLAKSYQRPVAFIDAAGHKDFSMASKMDNLGYKVPRDFAGTTRELAAVAGISHDELAKLWRISEDQLDAKGLINRSE